MKRALLTVHLLVGLSLTLATRVLAQDVTGTWITHNFGGGPSLIDLQASGGSVTGTISRNQEVMHISAGRMTGNALTFTAKSPGGQRVITYTGRLSGDELHLTRAVQVLMAGGDGAGIYGSQGPMAFVAARDRTSGIPVPRALFGNWRLNVQRSTYDPGPVVIPVVGDVRSYVSRPGGGFGVLTVSVGPEGTPGFSLGVFRADGTDYPTHDAPSVVASMASDTPTAFTRSYRAVGERSYEFTNKTSGRVTSTGRLTVSADGRTLTHLVTNLDAQGQTLSTNTLTFERIEPTRPPTD
jgi:hypothetical protein